MNKSLASAFGKTLKQARKKALLTQDDLAVKAGLDRSYISMLECGIRKPSLQCLLLLAHALNIDATTFLNRFLRVYNTKELPIPASAYKVRGKDRRVSQPPGYKVRSEERRAGLI